VAVTPLTVLYLLIGLEAALSEGSLLFDVPFAGLSEFIHAFSGLAANHLALRKGLTSGQF
jgi:hypothetical protein